MLLQHNDHDTPSPEESGQSPARRSHVGEGVCTPRVLRRCARFLSGNPLATEDGWRQQLDCAEGGRSAQTIFATLALGEAVPRPAN